jgi:hypothetical protein
MVKLEREQKNNLKYKILRQYNMKNKKKNNHRKTVILMMIKKPKALKKKSLMKA